MSRVAANGLVDAILVLDVAPDDARVALARQIATPTVFIGIPDDNEGLICVDLDFEAAAAKAVDLLADAGHTSLGLVGQTETAYVKSNFPPRVRASVLARAAERGIAAHYGTSGGTHASRAAARQTAGRLLDEGATALILHCADDAHSAVLAEVEARGLSVPADVSIVSVGAVFDTATLSTPLDSLPLVPQASCDLAVELALESLGAPRPEPGIRLIPPTYHPQGSIAAPAG
jgi:DNA-binding LacI/PurR family transcriptional regulator